MFNSDLIWGRGEPQVCLLLAVNGSTDEMVQIDVICATNDPQPSNVQRSVAQRSPNM
jgi:hypothetical protein